MDDRPKIGISRCLLGESVRYNGGHKLDSYIKYNLGEFVDFIEFCPEVEAGFGVPREAVQLHENGDEIVMLGMQSGKDYTNEMNNWLDRRVPEITAMELDGFILKSKSPSCGLYRTRCYREGKAPNLSATGFFAKRLKEFNPYMVIEEEGRLHDPVIRDNFVTRIFIHLKWRRLIEELSIHRLMKFQEEIKYTLMAHSPKLQKSMGFLVANTKSGELEYKIHEYYEMLNECLSKFATKKSNRNVLDHIMGYFKNELSSDEKVELKELIEQYHKGIIPLIVPVTLLNHYINKYNSTYLKDQTFLKPHPVELMLRNSI